MREDMHDDYQIDALESRIANDAVIIEKLVKALEPFAKIKPSSGSDSERYAIYLSSGVKDFTGQDLARARDALYYAKEAHV